MKKTMAFLLAIITLFLLSAPAFATSNSTWDTVTADDKVVIIVPKEERDIQSTSAKVFSCRKGSCYFFFVYMHVPKEAHCN